MGHSTDLSVFKRADPGLNFAFSDAAAHYHAPSDTVGNLDLRSVQHAGDYALARAARSARSICGIPGAGMRVLQHVGRPPASHPIGWTLPIAALVTCLFAGVVLHAARRRPLRRAGSLRGCSPSWRCSSASPRPWAGSRGSSAACTRPSG